MFEMYALQLEMYDRNVKSYNNMETIITKERENAKSLLLAEKKKTDPNVTSITSEESQAIDNEIINKLRKPSDSERESIVQSIVLL